MLRNTLIYWISTGLLAAQTAFAGILYFTSPEVSAGFAHFGLPDWFRIELGLAKILAAVAIILPMVPVRAKEWAYAGLAITFTSAVIAHTVTDGFATAVAPLITLAILTVSYIWWTKREAPAPALAL